MHILYLFTTKLRPPDASFGWFFLFWGFLCWIFFFRCCFGWGVYFKTLFGTSHAIEWYEFFWWYSADLPVLVNQTTPLAFVRGSTLTAGGQRCVRRTLSALRGKHGPDPFTHTHLSQRKKKSKERREYHWTGGRKPAWRRLTTFNKWEEWSNTRERNAEAVVCPRALIHKYMYMHVNIFDVIYNLRYG